MSNDFAGTPAPLPAASESETPVSSPADANSQATQQTPQAQEPATTKDENEKPDKPEKPKQTFQERMGDLYGRMKTAERQRDFALSELERLKKPLIEPEKRAELSLDELQRLDVREAVREDRAEEKRMEAERALADVKAHRASVFTARLEDARERMPDFDSVFHRDVPVTETMADIIADSEKGPEVAYYLGKNLSEARQIASLPPHLQGAAIARIEARVTSAPTVRKVSTAPQPPPILNGGSAPPSFDPSSASMDDYAKWYRERQKGNR